MTRLFVSFNKYLFYHYRSSPLAKDKFYQGRGCICFVYWCVVGDGESPEKLYIINRFVKLIGVQCPFSWVFQGRLQQKVTFASRFGGCEKKPWRQADKGGFRCKEKSKCKESKKNNLLDKNLTLGTSISSANFSVARLCCHFFGRITCIPINHLELFYEAQLWD